MTSPADKWIEAISTLNELTQTGQLRWRFSSNSPMLPVAPKGGLLSLVYGSQPTYSVAGAPFETTYEGKKVRISRFSVKGAAGGLVSSALEVPVFVYALDILSDSGAEIIRAPATTGLNDLFRSVEHQVSGIDDFLNSLLEDGKRLKANKM